MKKEELILARDAVKQQFDNLSSPNWVNTQLEQLRGKYDILVEVITAIEKEEQNAADSKAKQANRNNNKRG